MPDELLSPHFLLSQLTACPSAVEAGVRNEPTADFQFANLRRLAYALEVVHRELKGAPITVLRAFRTEAPRSDPASCGRSVDFIAPTFGSPRAICQALMGYGMEFDRLVCAPQWVQLDIPQMGSKARRQVQTARFVHGSRMQIVEGLW